MISKRLYPREAGWELQENVAATNTLGLRETILKIARKEAEK